MEDNLLMMASSHTDLNMENNRNYESGKSKNIEDGVFLALKSNCDWQKHTHHASFESMNRTFSAQNRKRHPMF